VRTSRFDFEFSLGTLIQALKRKIRPLPKGLKKDLERALDVRNLLAHKYFLKNQLKFLYGKWVRELVQELEEMRSVLQQVNRRLMAIYDALQRPKARLALKSIEGRAHETISMMAELVILAEECEESKNEEQLQEDL
jgi:hypothetical protein